MNRQELIKKANEELKRRGISSNHKESKAMFDAIFDVLKEEILKGKRVTITEFGTFKSILRNYPDPTGKRKKVEKWQIQFIPSGSMKESINEKT